MTVLVITTCFTSYPYTNLDRTLRLQQAEAPRFQDNQHVNVVCCQPYAPSVFTPSH